MYRGWPPPRGEYPPQYDGRSHPPQASHPGHEQLHTWPPFREDRGLPLPPVHHGYHDYGPPDPYRHSPPRRIYPSPGPGPGSDRGPGDQYWDSGPPRELRMKSPSPPRGGIPMEHSLVITVGNEQTPPETAPPLNPIPFSRDTDMRMGHDTDMRGLSRQGSSRGESCPQSHIPGAGRSRGPDPGRAQSREGQIGVMQKPEQIGVYIGPQTTKLPYEQQDCTLAMRKEDHVLLNLLTDIVSQNRRAASIKVLDEVKEEEEEKKVSVPKQKWKPVNTEVPFQVIEVLEDISEESHVGTVLRAILKIPQTPQAEDQPPEVGHLLTTVDGEKKELTFTAADIQTTATMLDGDKVKFNISTHRETKEERAVNLDIHPDTFEKSTEQRKTGMVVQIEEESGFIKCQQNPQLFFNMSEVMEVEKLELNQKVEFSVIPHKTAKGRKQAIRIKRQTKAVFTPVAKLPVLGANKEKKKMTIKLMRDASVTDQGKEGEAKPMPPAESDQLKAPVQTQRSQDIHPSDSRKDSDSSQRQYRRSRSKSNSPVRDKIGRDSRKDSDSSKRQYRRSRSRSNSPVQDKFGRHIRRKRSSSRERDRHSRSMQRIERSQKCSESHSRSRSRSRSRGRTGSRGHKERKGNSQKRSCDSSLPSGESRHSGIVDEELARKKRELEELNKLIASHKKTMVAVEPGGGMMDVRPTEKTCIDYDHGRIDMPLTGYKPNLLKGNDDSSGLLFPVKTESSDRDQYHYNPVTLDRIQTFDSPDHSHPSYTQTSSKKSYYDEPLYEQTAAQHSSYQSQSPQPSPPSQPPPNQTPLAQFSPRQMHHNHPLAPQSPPCQPPPSKTPKENSNLTTQIARFLNTLNKGVDATLLSTAVKEAQDQIAVIVEKTQELPQRFCELQAGDDKYRDCHGSREVRPEHTHRGFGPDDHDDLRTTKLNQDDLPPHKKAIWDGRVLSQIEGMEQEQYSRGTYQRETSMDEDEQFHFGRNAPAAEGERYRRSSGSADRHKRDRDGSSPTRETSQGSKNKSEHFDKIRSLLQTIGLNLNTAEVSKLADRTQERLYGRREELPSEHSDRERGCSSSRREDQSRMGSSDSEHLQSIVPVRLSSQEEYPDHQQQTSEYEGFLDRDEEEALEKARLMQTLINAEQAITPITPTPTPTPSTSQYPQELPGTSYSPTQYGWHQGASTQYSMPLGSAASSPGHHQTLVMYPPAEYPAYATQEGPPSGQPLHYYGPPPVGPPPVSPFALHPLTGVPIAPTSLKITEQVSPYALHPLTGGPIAAKPPKKKKTKHESMYQNLKTVVTLPTPTTDTPTTDTATTTTFSKFPQVIETVETKTVQKEPPKPEAHVQVKQSKFTSCRSSRAGVPSHWPPKTTENRQASPGPEDDIKAQQKERLEWFNQRMMEKQKRMMEKRKQTKDSKARNNSPGKVISSEPKNIWICGHSLVYWAEMRAKSPEVGVQLGMDPSSVVVWWKGTQGMTWPQLLPQLLQLKIKWPNPDMVIMHLGGNDLAINNLSDFLASVKNDLTSMRSIFPQCLLVWSDILPRRVWRHSNDSLEVDQVRATINRKVHSIIAELGGTALTHNNISCGTDTGLYRPDGVHLSGKGIDTFNLNLHDFLVRWEMEVNLCPEQS